jgi:DNA-binding transcriptional LysR family regulator
MDEENISLRHLRALLLMVEFGSPTRVAQILDTSQSAVSKMLARLRKHFNDPLFVRGGQTMRPTSKALELVQPLKDLLTSPIMRTTREPFNPAASTREFSVIVTEAGMIHLLLPIIRHLEKLGPGLKLKALALDYRQVEPRLESGEADIAIGAFPKAASTTKRQLLYGDTYVSIARAGHPQLKKLATLDGFMRERHVVVTSSTRVPYAHRSLDEKLSSRLKADRILVRVPNFLTSAFVVSETDAVGTVPARLARFLATKHGLAVFTPPISLPRIEINHFWHESVHNDEGHRWFRSTVHKLFS